MLERQVFVCEYCDIHKRNPPIFSSKEEAEYHESKCFYNPQNKACYTCKHNKGYRNNKCEVGNFTDIHSTATNCKDWLYKYRLDKEK